MWKIREVKSNGKQAMKKNYASCLIVSLIMVILVSGAMSITSTMDKYLGYVEDIGEATGSPRVIELVDDIQNAETKFRESTAIGEDSSMGVISGLYHSTKKTGTFAGGFLLVFDKLFLKGEVSTTIIIVCGSIVALLFSIFIQNNMRIGSARFFLENRFYDKITVSNMLFVFRSKKVRHCAWIMMVRVIFNLLWFLTIVGGVIKFYSYRMIPYLLAENPEMTRKEAFQLSMSMMKGNKFRTFLLDVTFVPWWILSVITFGLVQYLYLEPYMRSAYAELYIELRGEAIAVTETREKKELAFDYHRNYVIWNLILIFFSFALFGWIWECTLQILQDGHFVNRGSLYGPWVPIYGFGGIGLVVLLKRFVDKPILTFFLAIVVCGILEGGTGWYLDAVRGMRYWDYTNFYFNINGYVCLESLLVFGLGGCMFIYLLAPMLDTYFNKIPKKSRITLCVVLVSAFMSDVVYSHFNPHTGDGIGGYTDGTGGTNELNSGEN